MNKDDYSQVIKKSNKKLKKSIIKYLERMEDHTEAEYSYSVEELFRVIFEGIVKHNFKSYTPDDDADYQEELNQTYKFIISNFMESISHDKDLMKTLVKEAARNL